MKSPSAPAAPPPPPAPIESLSAADKELKSLTGRNFAMGGGGSKAGIANQKWGGVFARRAQKNDRVSQLTAYIQEQMETLEKNRRGGAKGRASNVQAPKPGAAPKGLGNPENKDQVLL